MKRQIQEVMENETTNTGQRIKLDPVKMSHDHNAGLNMFKLLKKKHNILESAKTRIVQKLAK